MSIEFESLLLQTLKEYLEKRELLQPLSKTKLIKLAYLVEYFFYQNQGLRLTDVDWVFYLYGPYVYSYEEALARLPFKFRNGDDSNIFEFEDTDWSFLEKNHIDSFEAKQVVKKVVSEYGVLDLPEILDFVYFDTEPMRTALQRNESLRFESIERPKPKITNTLTPKETSSILEKYKARLQSARRI